MWQNALFETIYSLRDEEKAPPMKAYMKNLFPFLGIPTPIRKKGCKEFFREAKKSKEIDWNFINRCWEQDYREFQYIAIDYLVLMKHALIVEDLNAIKRLILSKSWWDTIDGLDKIVGDIALENPAVNDMLLAWSKNENIWLRRIAIDHQLSRKEKTNTDLLEQILINNLDQSEFFINKAIGWSLREYSKTNPEWVRSFIQNHQEGLSSLSIREGSKYL